MRQLSTLQKLQSDRFFLFGILFVVVLVIMLTISGAEKRTSGFCPVRKNHDPAQQPYIVAVPGGGLSPDGTVPKHTELRLDRAMALCSDPSVHSGWKETCTIIVLSYGTTHKPPPLDMDKYPLTEAAIASQYLIRKGFPASQIREENTSLDTIGNAYFLRATHILPMSYTQQERMHMAVVTNDWHMPRTQAIFENVFSLPMDDNDRSAPSGCVTISFESVPSGLSPDATAGRREREMKSLESLLKTIKGPDAKYRTFRELSDWLFTKHNAYSAFRHAKSRDSMFGVLDAATLKSY